MICEVAPAKVNLTLEILGKRKDGYHDILSIMQTVDLCDILTFWDNKWIHIVPEYISLPGNDTLSKTDRNNYMGENLVYRAARILRDETGYKGGALILLKKNIPSSAGLGGGSSDAAATLRGLNRLWGLNLSNDELIEIGSKIGSDIAFFIHGGTCLIKGRGEIVTPIKLFPPKWILILLIPISLKQKTKKLYSYIDNSYYSRGEKTSELHRVIDRYHIDNSSSPSSIESCLFNIFEKVYYNGHEEFVAWREHVAGLGIQNLNIAGSGPAVYYISDNKDELLEMIDCDLSDKKEIIKYIARTVP